jgi:hypothetical protein
MTASKVDGPKTLAKPDAKAEMPASAKPASKSEPKPDAKDDFKTLPLAER